MVPTFLLSEEIPMEMGKVKNKKVKAAFKQKDTPSRGLREREDWPTPLSEAKEDQLDAAVEEYKEYCQDCDLGSL